jgi:hypothetical protein
MDLKIAKQKYGVQKAKAKMRNVPFLITFEEWCDVWKASGKWEQRGCGKGKYVMSRKGDQGPYSVNNIIIQTHADNNIEATRIFTEETINKMRLARIGKPGLKHTEETKAKLRKPKPKIMCPHCNLVGAAGIMQRWHMDNCKTINIK